MSTEQAVDPIEQVLGRAGADALADWADQLGRTVRLTAPPWSNAGFTGSRLAALIVSEPGGPDRQVIVKACPPGPYRQETGRHQEAISMSTSDFADKHLVEQLYQPHPTSDGGRLMFQDMAGGTLESVPLTQLPDADLPNAYKVVVHALIRHWNPSRTKTVRMSAREYLQSELHGALEVGGSLHAAAERLGLLRPEAAYLRDGGGETSADLPNPILMMDAPDLGALIEIDVVVGMSHGDLHADNILIPEDYGQLQPDAFRLVDLSAFQSDAPITRDPVMLMLSAVGPHVHQLRTDEQDALLNFVLRPWPPTPTRLSPLLAQILEAVYRTGADAVKALNLGDWRSQYLLSVTAAGLLFTTFANVGEGGRWWFLRLAGRAAAEFLKRHDSFRPQAPVTLRRPMAWPSAAMTGESAGAAVVIDDRSQEQFIRALSGVAPGVLRRAFTESVDLPRVITEPNWNDSGAVVRVLAAESAAAGELPWLLRYVEVIAHAVSGALALDLHRTITVCGERIGLPAGELRALCAATSRVQSRNSDSAISQEMGTNMVEYEHPDINPYDRGQPLGGRSVTAPTASTLPTREIAAPRPIRGGLPGKNPDFTGRDELLAELAAALRRSTSAVSVVAQALHGLGGVGKTQLAAEYVYRNIDRYSLIWWISAENVNQVRLSLAELGRRLGLGLPEGPEMGQTITNVMDFLNTSDIAGDHRWLLVYDNVDRPEDIHGLMPSSGGDVIITSRNNAAWSARGNAIEVDVFKRTESVELLQRHGRAITDADADRLAHVMGDLPLALEQAATWHTTTGMPVSEYLELCERHMSELLSEGKPQDYPYTVYAFVKVAITRLRNEFPAAADLLEVFAHLGAEPVSVSLLRAGRGGDLSDELGAMLQKPITLNQAIREIRRYGLARVDIQGQRIQVHRLIQRVLADELDDERRDQSQSNAQALLAAANPGYPDEQGGWPVLAEITPHIQAAHLIDAQDDRVRWVVVDQIRYLFVRGDYEASRALGEMVVARWQKEGEAPGPDHEQTLIAQRHLAIAYRLLGQTAQAWELDRDTFDRLRRIFGPDHEHTLYTANGLGVDLRLAGNLTEALRVEEDNAARHQRVLGPDDEMTRKAQNNLGSSLRHLGRFAEARRIDEELFDQRERALGLNDSRTLFSMVNLAHDNYGLGLYAKALELQRKAVPLHRDLLGPRHSNLLLASRALTMALRKSGFYVEARDNARDNYRDHHSRFGPRHEHTLSATISYANALRCSGARHEVSEARSLLREAVDAYQSLFGETHPLTLAAQVDLAAALRAHGDREEALAIDEAAYQGLIATLGLEHPYTLTAAMNLATDRALAGESAAAWTLSRETSELFNARGAEHPDALGCAINVAFDQVANGDSAGAELLDSTLTVMRRILGSDHPATVDAERGQRWEGDIEPPPT